MRLLVLISLCLISLCLPLHASDAQDFLNRVSQRVRANLSHMPRYSCEESIERFWYAPDKTRHEVLQRNDRIRLDVAAGSGGEMFTWHGDKTFRSGDIDELISNGPISSGTFYAFLTNIFSPGIARVKFTGNGGFTYAVAIENSSFQIHTIAGKQVAAYDGQFSADPASGRLLNLTVHSNQLPQDMLVADIKIRTEYATAHLGERELEMPTAVTMDMIDLQQGRTHSVVAFRNCQEFLGESTLRFDDASDTPAAPAPSRQPLTLAVGTSLAIRLKSAVDLEAAWAGDRIEGTLLTRLPGIPQKDPSVFGHLLRVEHLPDNGYNIDLQFDELVSGGATYPITLASRQLAVREPGAPASYHFRVSFKRHALKNAVTHWKVIENHARS